MQFWGGRHYQNMMLSRQGQRGLFVFLLSARLGAISLPDRANLKDFGKKPAHFSEKMPNPRFLGNKMTFLRV